jgi:hypothetical protein
MSSLAISNLAAGNPVSGKVSARFGMKQVLAILVALATVTATMSVTTSGAEARDRNGARNAALIGLGLLGGITLGALANSGSRSRYNNAYDDGYQDTFYSNQDFRPVRPRYVDRNYVRIVDDGYVVRRRPHCRIRSIRTYDDYGNTYRQRVRVCR